MHLATSPPTSPLDVESAFTMNDSATDAATSTASFHRFGALPPEIRRQIWNEALCFRCLVAPVFRRQQEQVTTTTVANRHPFFIGPAPYTVGQTCREAWASMVQMHVKDILVPKQLDDFPPVCWARPDTTVICLGTSGIAADAALARLSDYSLSTWRHVMIIASFFDAVQRATRIISASCPALETLIIEWSPEARPPSPSAERAALATACSDPMAPELDIDVLDTSKHRSLLRKFFNGPPPRIHFLPPYGA